MNARTSGSAAIRARAVRVQRNPESGIFGTLAKTTESAGASEAACEGPPDLLKNITPARIKTPTTTNPITTFFMGLTANAKSHPPARNPAGQFPGMQALLHLKTRFSQLNFRRL